MIHITAEGNLLKNGINFYPWKERKFSIGFRLRFGHTIYFVRYAYHVNKFMIKRITV